MGNITTYVIYSLHLPFLSLLDNVIKGVKLVARISKERKSLM
jgi:hypothetical protein